MLSKKKLFLGLVILLLVLLALLSVYLLRPLQPNLYSSNLAVLSDPCPEQWTCDNTQPGVVWMSRAFTDAQGYQVVHVLDIDPTLVTLKSVKTQYDDKYESVLSMGTRTNALAGVNGGFFCNYAASNICTPPGVPVCSLTATPGPIQPLSLLIISATQVSANCNYPRTSFGLTVSGTPEIQQIAPNTTWPGIEYAIGAGPNLVTNGKEAVATQEGFQWDDSLDPRTAAAITSNGHVLLVTIDGGPCPAAIPGEMTPDTSPCPVGMTLDSLAKFLIKEFDIVSAMNFDGGGSTTMYFGGKIVNTPSDHNPACDNARCVYDGLFVYAYTATPIP